MLKQIKNIFTGKTDIFASVKLNKFLGKNVLFIEKPHKTLDFCLDYIRTHKLKRVYLISPLNYQDFASSDEKEIFVENIIKILNFMKKKDLELVPHLHLQEKYIKNLNLEPDEKTKKDIDFTIRFFEDNYDLSFNKFSFGHWRITHKNRYLRDYIENKGLKLAKREFHIYDWWFI